VTPGELLTGKIPPHNLEAERAVLGIALLDPDAPARLGARLTAEDFFKEGHRQIFRALLALAAEGTRPDSVTLSAALRRMDALDEVGGPAYVGQLLDEAATLAGLDAYIAIVRDRAALRTVINLGAQLITEAYADGAGSAQAVMAQVERTVEILRRATAAASGPVALLGVGGGAFVAQTFPPTEAYVDGILTSDGTGWIGGEEKIGKSFYALEEALCLALGLNVCGRFTVAQSRRVLFIEEEDPPRRMHARLRALLRGHGADPDDPIVKTALDRQLLVSVWAGVTLDDPPMLARLEATIAAFRPAIVYLDVLRKLTLKDLNKADQAGALLASLDELRRKYGVLFRILHHYRKQQGFRTGRGSQEIGGSYVLGAWGECSLFFEPIGRTQGAVRVEVQTKDGPPVPAFRLVFQAEGPLHAPTTVTLSAEPESDRQDADDSVLQAVASLPKTEALFGAPGVTRAAVAAALKRSEATVRRALKRLEDAGRLLVTGQATKKAALYAVAVKDDADLSPRQASGDEQRRAGRAYRDTSSSSPSLPFRGDEVVTTSRDDEDDGGHR
jgi:hypothetical protein